jgi:capsid assembly protease
MSDVVCHRIAEFLSDRPIFMLPAAFRTVIGAVAPRLGLLAMEDGDDAGPSIADRKKSATIQRLASIVEADHVDVADGMGEYGRTAEGIAVIPIIGTTISRYDWLSALCGFCSYDTIKLTFEAAIADPSVKAILFDIDSPGGEAAGMLDCADLIRAGAAVKPTWASANSLAASAGFGLAAAASRLTLPRLGTVGSVGVVGIHVDQSGYDKDMGLKYTPIYSGAQKIDGWSHAALDKDALARIQARFDASRQLFAQSVAQFRGMSIDDVLETEAGVFDDAAAVDIGFADAVMSFEETLGELTDQIKPRGTGSTVSFAA